MESPYFPYGTYSSLLTGRDSGVMKYITTLGSLREIHSYYRFNVHASDCGVDRVDPKRKSCLLV